jgi:hypothetical protein
VAPAFACPMIRRRKTTWPDRARRGRDERGAAIVEFALVVPLLLSMLFGIAEFGVAFNDLNSARSGTREGARAGVVAEFGGSSACTLVGVAPGTPAAELICLTKDRIALDETDTRVMVAFDGENAPGGTLYVCSQHALESVTGLFSLVLDGRTLRTEVAMRIEEADPDLVPTAETALPGRDWSWCG